MKNLITKEEIDRINLFCKENLVHNAVINHSGTIDSNGNVNLYKRNLPRLSVNFDIIRGMFVISFNTLTSCDGFPTEVHGRFTCSHNKITSLIGGPQTVVGDYQCSNNRLTCLEGLPDTIIGNLMCANNNLVSLDGIGIIRDGIMCSNNHLSSLVGLPNKIFGNLECSGNNFESLLGAPEYTKGNFTCHSHFLKSTYSGDIDIEVDGFVIISSIFLPVQLNNNIAHIKIILKYQRHFEIWNDDLSLNEPNFYELISEINDGLM